MKKKYIYNYKFNSVFIKTFLLLIICTIIPVLIANYIIYDQSLDTIQKQTGIANINRLDKTSEMVDLVLKQINEIMPQLGKNSFVVNSVIKPDMQAISRNSEIIRTLRNIASSNKYILSIYIYNKENNSIFSSNGGSYNLNNFYDKEWLQAYNNFFLGTYQLGTREVFDALGNKFNCITLIRNLPYMSWSKLGAVIINISETSLYDTIAGETQNEEIFIINDDGYVISHKNKSNIYTNIKGKPYVERILENNKGSFIDNIDGKQMLFTYVTSSYNGWKYIYTIPVDSLQNNTQVVLRIIIITTILYILLSMALSYLISKGIYHPIEKLMDLVSYSSKIVINKKNESIKNEYDFLGFAYNNVIDKNKNMENILSNAKPTIKENLFTNLIMGRNKSKDEISEKLSFLKLGFSLTNFMVIGVQIDNYNKFRSKFNEMERSVNKIKLITIIEKIILQKYKGICIEVESDKLAVVINFPDDITLVQAKEASLKIADQIKSKVEKHFNFTITLGIGRMYKDIINIKLSYQEAVNALKYKLYQGNNEVINIEDINMESEELYYYDSEKEKMLINNLKIGHQKEAELFINEISKEVLEYRSISYTYVRQVFSRIVSSIIELIINMGLSAEDVFGEKCNLYEELSDKETIQDINNWLIQVCETTVNAINKNNSTKSQKHINRILEYIDDNYNCDISLNDIAECVRLSPAYVSKIFKDNIGKNYIDYLNSNRIEKAKQLLKNTQLAVKEVGFKVGFHSIQTFARTFKKYEGITPAQFREKS